MPRYDDGQFREIMLGKQTHKVSFLDIHRFLNTGDITEGIENVLANTWFDMLDYDEQYIVMKFADRWKERKGLGLNGAFRLAWNLSYNFERNGWQEWARRLRANN